MSTNLQREEVTPTQSAPAGEKISLIERLGYGSGDLASNFIWLILQISLALQQEL
ncbi:hypothetical protein NSQ89_05020 [Niallia sp. FSL R7-0648]|uniref:hypothetical protein n=1 Tax=Niallia sp. FSL R7-0648 TaxID=2954521 RepID=UPI0030F5AC3A